jgi:hypothetical protein
MLEKLIAAIIAMSFRLPADVAKAHVEAAQIAADKYHFSVELLLGVGFIESRYDSSALSRMQCDGDKCARVTKPWAGAQAPSGAKPSWYCGPMQSGGWVAWKECARMRDDLVYGYEIGAKELTVWMNTKQCASRKGDQRLRCALAGYNAGFAGVDAAATLKYPGNVLWAAQRIRQHVESVDRPSTPKS